MTGLIAGIIGSLIPRFLTLWQEYMDWKRQVAMMNLQAKLPPPAPVPEVLHVEQHTDLKAARKQEILMADKVTGRLGNVIRALISTVRPLVTFGVIGIWGAWRLMNFDKPWQPWEVDTLFFTVSYYFGQRGVRRKK